MVQTKLKLLILEEAREDTKDLRTLLQKRLLRSS